MRLYELTYLISPDILDPEIESFSQKMGDFIREEGGKTGTSTPLKKEKLGYPIKKKNEAFLGILDFNLSPDKLPNLEKKLKEQQEILRYTILIKELPKEEIKAPSVSEKAEELPLPLKKETKKVGLKEIGKRLEEILGG